MIHDLKTWPVYFRALLDGTKTFELRINDRNFALGDTLHCREYEPVRGEYTDRSCCFKITYVLNGGQMGLLPTWVIMGLLPISDAGQIAKPAEAPATDEAPLFRLAIVLRDRNPVMQIVEDDRGEFHQLTGLEMGECEGLKVGWHGTLAWWRHGARAAEFHPNHQCIECKEWSPAFADMAHTGGVICAACDRKLHPGE